MGANRQQGTNNYFAVEGVGTPGAPFIPVIRLMPATPVVDITPYRQMGASYLFAAAGLGTPDNPAVPLVRIAEDHPVGAFEEFPLHAIPGDRLECDGSEVERTAYPALFAVIGESWGAGNGTTTFNLPRILRRQYPTPNGPETVTVTPPLAPDAPEGAVVEAVTIRMTTIATTIKV
ncbi:MAG: phage tail protein [Alphaproteobacteria bacterium]